MIYEIAMSVHDKPSNNKVYIANRVGELADYANPLTFSLLQRIFGYKGPYRKILNKFHIGNIKIKESYLVNIHGRVYSDLDLENKVLWLPSMYELFFDGTSVKTKLRIFSEYFPKNVNRFIKKFILETKLASSPQVAMDEVEARYKRFSTRTKEVYENKKISVDAFLKLYEHVVYVSYLYDLITKINGKRNLGAEFTIVNEYIEANDFLVNTTDHYIEHNYQQMKFGLGEDLKVNSSGKKFIPDELPKFIGHIPPRLLLEVKLQCIKDNMRLKSNVLLYFLNRELQRMAYQKGVKDFGYLSIDEIAQLDKSELQDTSVLIENRVAEIEYGERKILKDIIFDGEVEDKQISKKEAKNHHVFEGIGCSVGKVKGSVQYIDSPKDKVNSKILMFPNASPTFTHQFKKAKGLIFKTGSPLSHGAIIAREMGIPAVVLNIKEDVLSDQNVVVSGDSGVVELI